MQIDSNNLVPSARNKHNNTTHYYNEREYNYKEEGNPKFTYIYPIIKNIRYLALNNI